MNVDVVRAWEPGDPNEIGKLILDLNAEEAIFISRALKYYTDKRKLPFDERMRAGDMARKLDEGISISVEEFNKKGE